jgi:hypothetical protein
VSPIISEYQLLFVSLTTSSSPAVVCKLHNFVISFFYMCILEGVFSGNLSSDMSEDSTWRIRRYGFCGMRSKKVHFSVSG